MEETKVKSSWGGVREGSGRPKQGLGTTPISLRIRKEYLEVLEKRHLTKNSFINDAIKEKLLKDGLIIE